MQISSERKLSFAYQTHEIQIHSHQYIAKIKFSEYTTSPSAQNLEIEEGQKKDQIGHHR